jgi:hypothetical protein
MKKPRKKPSDRATTAAKSFFYWEGETLVLNILGKPSAKNDAIGKPYGHQLKVSVTAAPPRGQGDRPHGALSGGRIRRCNK